MEDPATNMSCTMISFLSNSSNYFPFWRLKEVKNKKKARLKGECRIFLFFFSGNEIAGKVQERNGREGASKDSLYAVVLFGERFRVR